MKITLSIISLILFISCSNVEKKPLLVYDIEIKKDIFQLGVVYGAEVTYDTVMAIDTKSALKNLFKKAIVTDMTGKQLKDSNGKNGELYYYSGVDTSGISFKQILSEEDIDSIKKSLHGMLSDEVFQKFKD